MSANIEYLVVFQQIITGALGWDNTYFPQGERMPIRAEAIAYGLVERGSDDFNIAVVQGDTLLSFDWMEEAIGEDAKTMQIIAAALGLTAATIPAEGS